MPRVSPACIYVLAGTNGSGKSSIGGAIFRSSGAEVFDPDEAALRLLQADPGMSRQEGNGVAWHEGKRLLEQAIAERLTFALETTLGGDTITRLLARACSTGIQVRIWYVGLEGAELHIERVRARVRRGGHAVPSSLIRQRYDSSRANLVRLLPRLTELRLFDNSAPADPAAGRRPEPVPILHVVRGRIAYQCDPAVTPGWARPIVAAAMKGTGRPRRR